MNPPAPQTQDQLDPSVVRLAQSISKTETRGQASPYTAKGGSGEYGAYQYTAPTWQADSQKYLGQTVPLEQATPEQQDKVAYHKIYDLGKQGYKPNQIASIWNSGKPDPTGNVGVNKHGVKYDTPGYVKSVEQAYNQLQGGQKVDVPPTASTVGNTQTGTPDSEGHSNILSKLMDFAFPIVNDIGEDFKGTSKKSALQQVGDLGLSAMWFVPGLGEVGGALKGAKALEAAGLLGKGAAKLAGSKVAQGATLGYGTDVASNFSQGKTGGAAFAPGLGTATGGVLGGALGKIASKYSQKGVVGGITDANNAVIGQTKKGANELADSLTDGRDLGHLAAEKGISIPSMYDKETVAFNTKPAAAEIRNQASTLNQTVSEALKRVPGGVTLPELQTQVAAKIDAILGIDKVTAQEYKNIVNKEFQNIGETYGDTLSASELNELKNRHWGLSKFDMATPNTTRKAYRIMGNTLKTSVEDLAQKGGLDGIKEMNQYIGSHHDLADILEYLNGTKAKGGRLGDLLHKQAGEVVGAGLGGVFGGGIPGALAGAIAGHFGGKVLASVLRKAGSSPIKTAILNRIVKEDPEIVQKMLAYAKQTPQGLEAIKEQLGQKGISIFDKLKNKKNIAPVLTPKKGSTKITSGLLKGGLRLATPSGQ